VVVHVINAYSWYCVEFSYQKRLIDKCVVGGGGITARAPDDMTQSQSYASLPTVWGGYLSTQLGRHRATGDGMG
jgi:hypothetical protein